MKSLLIVRHAHASGAAAFERDEDRPLSGRGSEDATRLGRRLLDEGLVPELVLSSTAVRATDTADRIAASFTACNVVAEPRLYLASPETCIEHVRALEPSLGRVLVIGHNPGVEVLVSALTGLHWEFGPADLAEVALPLDRWDGLELGTRGELVRFWSADRG